MSDTVADPMTLYATTRDRFIALVRPLGPDQAGRTVPMTPGWSVVDVLAHLCGLNADVASGLREGLGTDERTAHQVAVRAGRSVAEICDEWLGLGEAMAAAAAVDGFFGRRLSADLVVHLHDVQHALGVPIDRTDEAAVSGGRTYAARIPDLVMAATGVGLVVELGEGHRFGPAEAADGLPTVTLETTPYDFLRSVTGRRSRAQVAALDWHGDPTPILDHLCPYGPLRSTDAEI